MRSWTATSAPRRRPRTGPSRRPGRPPRRPTPGSTALAELDGSKRPPDAGRFRRVLGEELGPLTPAGGPPRPGHPGRRPGERLRPRPRPRRRRRHGRGLVPASAPGRPAPARSRAQRRRAGRRPRPSRSVPTSGVTTWPPAPPGPRWSSWPLAATPVVSASSSRPAGCSRSWPIAPVGTGRRERRRRPRQSPGWSRPPSFEESVRTRDRAPRRAGAGPGRLTARRPWRGRRSCTTIPSSRPTPAWPGASRPCRRPAGPDRTASGPAGSVSRDELRIRRRGLGVGHPPRALRAVPVPVPAGQRPRRPGPRGSRGRGGDHAPRPGLAGPRGAREVLRRGPGPGSRGGLGPMPTSSACTTSSTRWARTTGPGG